LEPTQSQTQYPSVTRYCRQEAETAALARNIGRSLEAYFAVNPQAHLNLSLVGDLGVGKTTFARHLIQGMGYAGRVKSPTYTLCEPYPFVVDSQDQSIYLTAHHFDLYRMRDPSEWQEAGFAEHFDAPGFCLVEWPEKAEGTLPTFDLAIHLAAGKEETERTVNIESLSKQGNAIINKLDN